MQWQTRCSDCDALLVNEDKVLERWVLVNWWNGLEWVTRRYCLSCSREHEELIKKVSEHGGTIQYFEPDKEEI